MSAARRTEHARLTGIFKRRHRLLPDRRPIRPSTTTTNCCTVFFFFFLFIIVETCFLVAQIFQHPRILLRLFDVLIIVAGFAKKFNRRRASSRRRRRRVKRGVDSTRIINFDGTSRGSSLIAPPPPVENHRVRKRRFSARTRHP